MSIACVVGLLSVNCGSSSDTPAVVGGADAETPDASDEQRAQQPDAQPETAPKDPLCPEGQTCSTIGSGSQRLSCLVDGHVPPGASTGCSTDADCTGNFGCRYTNPEKTESACVENCGVCPTDTTCMDVVGDGYLGCLVGGIVPDNAPTGCAGSSTGCAGNATCFYLNATKTESACIDNCSPCREGTCPSGKVCDGIACADPPCTEGSCPQGEICYAGTCIPDPGSGPGNDTVTCANLPKLLCDKATENCAELIQFEPTQGDGYWDYPENGETSTNQYRSWLRRDLVYVVKYAAAKVACKAKDWTFGNGGRVGLIDMSEKDGKIPGTSVGDPAHPTGTHTNGVDIDIAYYQVNTPDNRGRPVCEHTAGGADAYHCTKAPHLLDPWRTALFLGAANEHPQIRVIGVDGKVGPIVEMALSTLCQGGWIPQTACNLAKQKLAYEETNQGHGWYLSHHHHFHVSFIGTKGASTAPPKGQQCLIPGCDTPALEAFIHTHTLAPRALPRAPR